MSGQVVVPVALLRQAASTLLAHLEATEGPTVSLDKDYFWSIAPAETYDVYHEPSDFSVGQLSERLAKLERAADGSAPLSYALVWLADVLRATGQAVVQ